MFKRKIYDKLLKWKNERDGSTALLIEGARRIGKSTVALELAKNEYDSYMLIDFSIISDIVKGLFNDISNIDDFFSLLFLSMGKPILPKGSLIIFDEIQFCPKARQAIKHLVADGRYHYIETGSLISIKENVADILIPSEEETISMFPMDYEEFLWAIGYKSEIDSIKSLFNTRNMALCSKVNQTLIKNYRLYMAVGGMPQAVSKYVETKDFFEVDKIKKDIIQLYESDLRKIDLKYKTICKRIWDQIPSMLSKHSTRFVASSVDQRADSELFQNSLEKLKESKMVYCVHKCSEPKIGFKLTSKQTAFKLYYSDIGLFTSIVYSENGDEALDIYKRIILADLDSNFGMFFENACVQTLVMNNHVPYYYSWSEIVEEKNETTGVIEKKNKNYEIDFMIYKKGHVIPIEVKSSKIKSITSLIKFKEKYSKGTGEKYVCSPKPLRYGDNLTYLPLYMMFLF